MTIGERVTQDSYIPKDQKQLLEHTIRIVSAPIKQKGENWHLSAL